LLIIRSAASPLHYHKVHSKEEEEEEIGEKTQQEAQSSTPKMEAIGSPQTLKSQPRTL